MSIIKGEEKNISKVLSSDFEFYIPDYQRPYSWTREQAAELFDDLWTFLQEEGGEEKYFLGSVVLVKGESRHAEVVDGQQRLSTLTILLAALNERLADEASEYRNAFESYIIEPGKIAEGLEARPRLFLRSRDREFFQEHIQKPGGLEKLESLAKSKLPDAPVNIRDNAMYFRERLTELSAQEALELGQFIVRNCFLVLVITDSLTSAYRIFSVLNDRGLELEPSDILKARVIGKVEDNAKSAYTTKWENMEEQLGRKDFNAFLSHVRMIFQKEKARRSVIEEFERHVLSCYGRPESLVDEVLLPYSTAYHMVVRGEFESMEGAERINRLLELLNRLNNFDWVPVAMEFVIRFRDDPEMLERHVAALERLASTMFVRSVYVTPRVDRFGKVLAALEADQDMFAADSPLALSRAEMEHTTEVLDGPVYQYPAKLRKFIMLRLDGLLSGAGVSYEHRVVTIEHVLPRNPPRDSEWRKVWSEEEREKWVDRLGNLVLLARDKNAEASNHEFSRKKSGYFQSPRGVSPYATSTQVLCHDAWTPEIVASRQRECMEVLKEGWKLQPSST